MGRSPWTAADAPVGTFILGAGPGVRSGRGRPPHPGTTGCNPSLRCMPQLLQPRRIQRALWGGPPGPRPTPPSAHLFWEPDLGVRSGRGRPPHPGTTECNPSLRCTTRSVFNRVGFRALWGGPPGPLTPRAGPGGPERTMAAATPGLPNVILRFAARRAASSTASDSARFVGRSPWTAADAPVATIILGAGPGVRSGRGRPPHPGTTECNPSLRCTTRSVFNRVGSRTLCGRSPWTGGPERTRASAPPRDYRM